MEDPFSVVIILYSEEDPIQCPPVWPAYPGMFEKSETILRDVIPISQSCILDLQMKIFIFNILQ